MLQSTPNTELSPAQRKTLKALAHHLNPVVMVGEKGLTAAVIKEIDVNLQAHQLIKVRISGDDRQFRLDILEAIVSATLCQPVQHIGKLLVLYRAHPEKSFPDLHLSDGRSNQLSSALSGRKAAASGQASGVRKFDSRSSNTRSLDFKQPSKRIFGGAIKEPLGRPARPTSRTLTKGVSTKAFSSGFAKGTSNLSNSRSNHQSNYQLNDASRARTGSGSVKKPQLGSLKAQAGRRPKNTFR